jgi:hypothetical protein
MATVSAANYGGKQPNNTAYIKNFYTDNNIVSGTAGWFYKIINNIKYITPVDKKVDVFIQNNLLVNGSINNPSDIRLKENITEINNDECDKILSIRPIKYCFKHDEKKEIHFGISAQELENYYPELVKTGFILDNEENSDLYKSINYLELIPLLIVKMKHLQNKIDFLEDRLNNCST